MFRKVVIVILNYKNYNDTIECLNSLFDISYSNYEIVVVDNFSENDSLEYIEKFLVFSEKKYELIKDSDIECSESIRENIILLQSSKNGGYAAGNNLGIRTAIKRMADYVLILNNDTVVKKNFLESMVEFAESNERAGVVGPKVLDIYGEVDKDCARRKPTIGYYFFCVGMVRKILPNNYWYKQHYYCGEYDYESPKKVDLLSGCCMLIKKDIIKSIGLLDENTFLYVEEHILCEKLQNNSYYSAIVPHSIIIHKRGKATSQSNSLLINEIRRSSIRYYLLKYRKYPVMLVWLIMLSIMTPRIMQYKIKLSLQNILGVIKLNKNN